MTLETLLAAYCLVIVLASTAGGHLPGLIRMTHLRTQLLISFVGGLMLGIALLHLFPHAVVTLGSASKAGIASLVGIIAMFLLLRAFHPPHTHGFVDATPLVLAGDDPTLEASGATAGKPPVHGEHVAGDQDGNEQGHEHGHEHEHEHEHEREQGHGQGHGLAAGCEQQLAARDGEGYRKSDQHAGCDHAGQSPPRWIGWIGILVGLWLHTLIDGVALAASTVADAQHAGIVLAGLGTFLAVALHKPLDAFTITSTMHSSGWSPWHQAVVNVIFAMACPVGALLFYFGFTRMADSSHFLGWGLAISAGFFICISLADLLPEVSFHQHDRGKLTLALFLGIGLAIAVENLPGHSHIHTQVTPDAQVDSDLGPVDPAASQAPRADEAPPIQPQASAPDP